MTELCTNCRSKVIRDEQAPGNYTGSLTFHVFNVYLSTIVVLIEARLESDMQNMMLRLDQMQEMMAKLLNYLPNVLPNANDLVESMQIASIPTTPVKSRTETSSQMCSIVEKVEVDDVMIAETYIAEDLASKGSPAKSVKRLPSVILEQPIDSESIGFISSTSCENSQDTCSDDMFHESFLEVAMKQMVGDEELDLLSSIDNVYHLENLHQTFPILHQEELDAMEEQMKDSESYKEQLMKELKLVRISMGVNCDFADILEKLLDRELLHYYNWYGNQGKKSLQRYKIFNQCLREITIPPNGKSFDDIMHRALTVSHRRKNNQVYRKKRKIDAYYK